MDAKQIILLWVAATGWAFAAYLCWTAFRERRGNRKQDQLFQAFPWFDGGAQRCSVGIAIVEGFWVELPSHRRLMVPLLANQAIYLLSIADERTAQELGNLDRIMRLLTDYPSFAKDFAHLHAELQALTARTPARLGPTGSQVAPTQIAAWHGALLGAAH